MLFTIFRDFTVMGPNVNLASPIESLTKEVGITALFTESIAQHVPRLLHCATYSLKGITAPVDSWKLP